MGEVQLVVYGSAITKPIQNVDNVCLPLSLRDVISVIHDYHLRGLTGPFSNEFRMLWRTVLIIDAMKTTDVLLDLFVDFLLPEANVFI